MNHDGSDQDLEPMGGDRTLHPADSRDGGAWQDARGSRDPHGRGARESGRVEDAVPPIKPRNAGELLDLALEIVRDRFALIVGTCVLLWLPVRILEPFIGSSAWVEKQSELGEMTAAMLTLASLGVTLCLQLLVQALASAIVARLVYARMHGQRMEVRVALGQALRHLPGLVVIVILTTLATTVGACFCLAPFVYLYWKLSIAPFVYVLEDVGIGQSMTRSFSLSIGSFMRWLAIVVVMIFLTLPFTGLVAGSVQPQARAFMLEALSIPGGTFDAIMVVLSSIFMGLATAIGSVTTTLFYLDCRVRREGYDLRRAVTGMRAGLDPPPIAPIAPGTPRSST